MYERDFVKTLAARLAEPRRFQIERRTAPDGKEHGCFAGACVFQCADVSSSRSDRPRDRRSKKLEEV